MHVLMFGWEFPPHNSGGLGVACYGLARALASKNVDIDFVLPKRMDVSVDFMHLLFADIGNVKIHRIKTPLYPYVTSEGYLKTLSSVTGQSMYGSDLFAEVERYAFEGARIAEKVGSIDVVHAHDWLSFGAGIAASEVSHKPLVAHVHATEIDRTGGQGANQKVFAVEKAGVRKAAKLIAVSNYTKQILVNSYQADPNKVTVVHNGLDFSQYFTSTASMSGISEMKKLGYKVVLFVGRITMSKGVDYLLYAASMVLKYDPKVLFIIAGSGDMERQIIEQAARLGISKNILFAGFARGQELSALYKTADLFVMPSVSEPFGLTALEALIHDTPVLISKQSGVSEVLTHALKVDFWDTWEMANKILSVVSYPTLGSTLKDNGKVEAYKCTWDKAAGKCLDVYQEVLTNH